MENKTAQEIIRERSDSKQDYFLFVEGDRDTVAEDVIVRWMEKYANQKNRDLEALLFGYRQTKLIKLHNDLMYLGFGADATALLKEFDEHFNITSERHGEI